MPAVLDVLVVGAGLSGLFAARRLQASGLAVRGSAGQVPPLLAAELQRSDPQALQLGDAVVSIAQNNTGAVVYTTSGRVYQGRAVIVAVPPPLRAAIRFEPELPPAHRLR